MRAPWAMITAVLIGCRHASTLVEPAAVQSSSAGVAVDDETIQDQATNVAHDPVLTLPEGDDDDWGSVSDMDSDISYGAAGLGRPLSMGPMPEDRTFGSLADERKALEVELAWIKESIAVLIIDLHRWRAQHSRLRAQTPVDADELARVEERLEITRRSLELNRKDQARYQRRLDEITGQRPR